MALIYAGIDEAGYGPLLGPLCVGLAVFRVQDWSPGDRPPDLWDLLASGVARTANDRKGRVAIADSKKLKLPNSSKTRHPLVHLERGVLAGLSAAGSHPQSDTELFASLRAQLGDQPWYAGAARPVPVGSSADAIAIASNVLAGALARSGVELLELGCIIINESRFNEIVRTTGTKARATLEGVGEHLRCVRDRWAEQDSVRIVCDRLGGRLGYAGVLERELGVDEVTVIEQSPRVCRYDAGGLGILFQPEAEIAHLPVALASMIAKLVRELAMARLNDYWCARMPELKPTAGYTQDARRWLADTAGILTETDRAAMIRIA